jgi:hypothetical protein
MDKYTHLEDTRQPIEHDEDAEEQTMITGLKNPDDNKYDAIIYWEPGKIDWDAEEW